MSILQLPLSIVSYSLVNGNVNSNYFFPPFQWQWQYQYRAWDNFNGNVNCNFFLIQFQCQYQLVFKGNININGNANFWNLFESMSILCQSMAILTFQFQWQCQLFRDYIVNCQWQYQYRQNVNIDTTEMSISMAPSILQYGPDKQLSPCEIQSCSDMSKMLGHPLLVPKIYQKMVKTHSKSLL